jgi:hypothetical protein
MTENTKHRLRSAALRREERDPRDAEARATRAERALSVLVAAFDAGVWTACATALASARRALAGEAQGATP